MANTACAVNIPTITNAFISKDGIEILSDMKAPRYADYINVLFGRVFLEEYLNDDSYTTLSDFSNFSGEELTVNGKLINLYNKVKAQLKKDIESNFYDNLHINTVNDISKIWKNWDLFVNYHRGLNTFISAKNLDDQTLTEEEKEEFDKRGNEYTEFDLVSNKIRTLFKFLPKAEFYTDLEGKTQIKEAYDPIDGLPMRGDYENLFKLTFDALKGIKDEGKFIAALTSEELLKKLPELHFLYPIILDENKGIDNLLDKQRLLLNSLYSSFSRDYIPVHLSIREESETKDNLPSHIRTKAAKGNIDKIKRQFISNFSSNQEENKYVKIDNSEYEPGKTSKDSTDKITYVNRPEDQGLGIKRLYSLPKKLDKIQLTDEDITSITISKIQSDYKDYFDFFKLIGIEFSDLSLLKSNKDKLALIKVLNYSLKIHDNISKRIENGKKIYHPIEDISGRNTRFSYQDENKKIVTVPRLAKEIKDIIKFEASFSKISPTVMSRTASGEKQSDISYSNALSLAAGQISSVNSLKELYTKSYFKKLRYNPLHLGSYVASEIIRTDNKYSIENYSGHIVQQGENEINSDTKSLSDVDKFKSDFSNLLGWGVINTPQLESKAGYFAIKFLDQDDNAKIPFSTINFQSEFLINNTPFFNQVLSYLKGELQRVKDYPTLSKSYSVPEAYGKLHIFANMMSDEQLNYLLNNEWDYNDRVIQEIKPNIEKYFQDQFEILKNFIHKNGINNLVTSNVLRTQEINQDLYKESPEFYQDLFLRSFIANDFVHNVEFGIYISGDPLFYKDYHKRLGGLASTGIQPANTENLKLLFNGDRETIFWNNYSLRGILNQDNDKPVARRSNFDTFQSAVLREDTVNIKDTAYGNPQTALDYIHSVKLKTGKDITLEQAIKDLKLKDSTIDIGDGEGYLNLDAHRELSIKQDTYEPQHDVSYKYEALTFKKYILKKDLNEDEQKLFVELEGQILRDPNKYALPILKQTYYGTLANEEVKLDAKVFDKFSLAPLLPSIAKNHPKLQKLLMAMASRQIHYVKYKSGTKGYVRDQFTVDDLLNEKTRLDELQSELLKLQITPAKEEKLATKIPTQMVKLIYTNLFDRGNASPGVIEARNNFIEKLNSIQATNKSQVLNKLGFKLAEDGSISSWDKEKIIKRIINQINIQKLPSNLLEALKLDSSGNFINTIESSGVYQQLLNYITGKLDRSLREFKMNGGDFVLISESMFSTPLKYFRLSKDKSKILPLELRITLTKEFAKLLELPDPSNSDRKIGSLDRLNKLLSNKDFVKKYEKELTVTFSRPPVQGPNSMGVGVVVEFFSPTAGNVLQLPKEFMHQGGIDFDYDKEKVLIPAFSEEGIYLSEEGIQKRLKDLEKQYKELREVFEYVDEYLEESESYDDYKDFNDLQQNLLQGSSFTKLLFNIFNKNIDDFNYIPDELVDLEYKAIEYLKLKFKEREINSNQLLQSIITSLQLPELYSELILPNTDSTVRPLAITNGNEINNLNTLPIGNSVYSYMENLKVFKMFNDAKALLGPFALQNVFSQLIAPLDISMNLDYYYDKNGRPKRRVNNLLLNNKERTINISTRENISGENKQHLNSEFINATVDSAKDPYFANFMLSFDNINTFMFMFVQDYPIDTIVDFTSSAIVRKFLEIKSKNKDLKVDDIVAMTFKNVGIKTKKLSRDGILEADASNIDMDNSELLDNLKSLKSDLVLDNRDVDEQNIILLYNFIALTEHSKNYGGFKGLFNNDTNKVTSLFEIFTKQANRNDVINAGMFSETDIKKVEDSSTMTAFRNDDIIGDILRTVFPIVSETKIVNMLGSLFNEKKPSLKEVDSRIMSQVLTNDFIGSILFTYGSYKDGNIFDYAKNLLRKIKNKETNTYNTVLLERLYKLRQNEGYSELLEKFPVLAKISGNVSTKPLKGNPLYGGKYAFNTLLDIDSNTPLSQKENYMNQFKQIVFGDFVIDDLELKETLVDFTKDFFIAGLMQSGLNPGGISYFEYIPIEFTQQLLQPALNFFNFEKANRPENFELFIKNFLRKFKNNNSSYYYKSDSISPNSSTYLGKDLRMYENSDYDLADPDWFYKEYMNLPVFEEAIVPEETKSAVNEFTYKGKTIATEFALGEEQTKALQDLIDFAEGNSEDFITLQGAAGTGKTSIIGYLQKYLGSMYSFAYIAPTHAATAELAVSTAKTGNNVLPSTLQSSLTTSATTKKHIFSIKLQRRLSINPIIVLDEASMIDQADIKGLQEAVENIGGKLIFLGDEKQISKVVTGDISSKFVSPAFTDFKQINLTKIFRQSNNNLLSLLSMMRQQTDFKLFKISSSDSVKFVDKKEYNRELIEDLKTNPENTVVVSYTNNSVKGVNLTARKILGREGQTVVGDIVIGYLGYATKQIEKGDIANSVSYTIQDIVENDSVRTITVKSAKLSKLIDLGITGISNIASTNYYQLASGDSLTFDNLSQKDYDNNNKLVSAVFKKIHEANEAYKSKQISYQTYLSLLQGYSETLRKYSVGDEYVYNPTTEQMEKYDVKKHKGIKTNGQGSLLMNKDIDYGHAITIHKSQGSTIDNVYFDSSSLKSASNTPIIDTNNNQITTEKQSLAYVAMSRSKNKLVVYEGENAFEMLDVAEETKQQTLIQRTDIYSQLGNKTVSENVEIVAWADLKEYNTPIEKDTDGNIEYVIATRIPKVFNHFGNPFSHDPAGKTQGLIKTETIKEAVEKYIDWVINSDEERAKWIRKQLQSGNLKNKPILYFKELGEPSHATALDYLINKYNWNTQEAPIDIAQPKIDISLTPSDFTNHSGGALGSDTEWENIGKEFGFNSHTHYWMNNKTPNGNQEISEEDKIEGQQKVTIAARQMGRIEPTHQVRDERLIRNWSQVKYADAVFAITTILKVGEEMNYGKKALIIQGKGGTGYAIQMAINEGKPVYIFDQERNQWTSNINGVWSKTAIPILTQNFAGIGTREINANGLKAIRDVYRKTLLNIGQQEASTNTAEQPTKVNITISEENYTKQTPNDKSRGFFFTENLQAYLANRNRYEEAVGALPYGVEPKLDVTATNNQAGIRIDEDGEKNENAFAIISKKFQQTKTGGTFVQGIGQFEDTKEDFELFKKYNTEAIQEALDYGKPLVIAKGGIATGKSALPLRFAEWLASELTDKLNITGEIRKNTTEGYDGYGIFNLEIAPSTKATIDQDIEDIINQKKEESKKCN